MDLTKRLTMTVDILSSLPGHHALLPPIGLYIGHGEWLHYDVGRPPLHFAGLLSALCRLMEYDVGSHDRQPAIRTNCNGVTSRCSTVAVARPLPQDYSESRGTEIQVISITYGPRQDGRR